MATIQPYLPGQPSSPNLPGRGASLSITPETIGGAPPAVANRLRGVSAASPVNQNGSFEFDRVLKSGYVQKRTQKTKTWKTVYLVLRPNNLSIYKSDKESKLRRKIYTSDLSAVTPLKDPKQKRENLFGLFSPAKNLHFQAPTLKDAQEWIERIRVDARIEEEEEEMFLASPVIRRQSFAPVEALKSGALAMRNIIQENDRLASSSPEPLEPTTSHMASMSGRRRSHYLESSGLSGNEMMSHSDFSDNEGPLNMAVKPQSSPITRLDSSQRPDLGDRNGSHVSGLDQDPHRVVWQGWMSLLKSKRGVRQWKHCWAVLRPKNLILYKDESEYTASFILALSAIVNVVDIDPISKTKTNCMQIITDEKSYRFCAPDEESLLQCLGAFKSLLTRRKELEARVAASGNTAGR